MPHANFCFSNYHTLSPARWIQLTLGPAALSSTQYKTPARRQRAQRKVLRRSRWRSNITTSIDGPSPRRVQPGVFFTWMLESKTRTPTHPAVPLRNYSTRAPVASKARPWRAWSARTTRRHEYQPTTTTPIHLYTQPPHPAACAGAPLTHLTYHTATSAASGSLRQSTNPSHRLMLCLTHAEAAIVGRRGWRRVRPVSKAKLYAPTSQQPTLRQIDPH